MCGFHLLQIYFLWVAGSVVARSLALLLGSIQHLPSRRKGLWGTVTSLYVSIRKTPSGISFLMLPGSTITSVSVSAGSPEPVPSRQTEGERAELRRLVELLFQLPPSAEPHLVSTSPALLAPSPGAGVWSCFGNRCDSGMTSPRFCSISVSILVRRFLLSGSGSGSPGVSTLFLLLHNSPGISFQLFFFIIFNFSFLHLLHSSFFFPISFFSSFFFSPPLQTGPFLPQNWLSRFIFAGGGQARSAAASNPEVPGCSRPAGSCGRGTGREWAGARVTPQPQQCHHGYVRGCQAATAGQGPVCSG